MPEPETDRESADDELPRETWNDHIRRAEIAAHLATAPIEQARAYLEFLSRQVASEDTFTLILARQSAANHMAQDREHHKAMVWLRSKIPGFVAILNSRTNGETHSPPPSKPRKVKRRSA